MASRRAIVRVKQSDLLRLLHIHETNSLTGVVFDVFTEDILISLKDGDCPLVEEGVPSRVFELPKILPAEKEVSE